MSPRPRSRDPAHPILSAVRSVIEDPWLQSWAYILWAISGIVAGLTLGFAEDVLPPYAYELLIVVSVCVFGVTAIVLSRALASGRDSAPIFVRIVLEGRGAIFNYGPWVFRFGGSAAIGFGIGRGVWALLSVSCSAPTSFWVGIIVGGVVGLAIWVWTWFLYSAIEE